MTIASAHKIHFPAEYSSNLNQTHLSMLINVFRIIRKSQVGEFDQGCPCPSRARFEEPWYKYTH